MFEHAKQRTDAYEIVTKNILAQLEKGVIPWRKPWTADWPMSLATGKQYRGLNPFLLGLQGYGSKYWLTENHAKRLGGTVRVGEKSTMILFGGKHVWTAKNKETDELETRSGYLMRIHHVFNVEQTDLAEKLGLGNCTRTANIPECEKIVDGMPNKPRLEQDARAWYRPSTDTVGMPSRTAFNSLESFYSTMFHELTHSTGHKSRVGRDGIEKLEKFGSESYSKEELVAELGAAMLSGLTGISPAVLEQSAAYLKNWTDVLKGDSKLIVAAASAAQKACDYILNTRPQAAEETPAQ